MATNVLIVDDHPLVRAGVRQVLAQSPSFGSVLETDSGHQAIQMAAEHKPDVTLMDLNMPGMGGIEATRLILESWPEARIIVLSGDADRMRVNTALQVGARGYLYKQSVLTELLIAIDQVTSGGLYFSPEISASILVDYRRAMFEPNLSLFPPAISPREAQLLRLISDGARSKEIVAELNLSPNSIETYRSRLMKKLGCASTAELVRYAIRSGIVTP
jgi:two-component system invasion response regulator UvrY